MAAGLCETSITTEPEVPWQQKICVYLKYFSTEVAFLMLTD